MNRRSIAFLAALVAAAGLVSIGCPNPTSPDSGDSSIVVSGVSLNKSSAAVLVGAFEQLYASVSPAEATDKRVTWSSDNPSAATVSASGLVTGQGEGTAVITVTTEDGGFTADCSVAVSPIPVAVTGVSLDKASTSIEVGNTDQLTATISPANATNQGVTWGSDNEAVAVVSAAGLVTAVSLGTADITVTTDDGGFTASCAVTVVPVAVTGVSLDKASATIEVENTDQLTETVTPANAANKDVTWSSDNEAVATVSGTGLVTAVNAGTATISVTTDDGGFTASCAVTVRGIYIGGGYEPPGGRLACYWKNGARVDLPGIGGSAVSVCVDAGNVYVSGWYGPDDGEIACYWKNGVKKDLPVPLGTTISVAKRMFISGSDVYIAGAYSTDSAAPYVVHACYWKNDSFVDLLAPADSEAWGVFVLGTDVYLTGYYYSDPDTRIACYWLNGSKTDLPGVDGIAADVTLAGGSNYVAGWCGDEGTACYWVDGGAAILLDTPGYGADAWAIAVVGSDVFTAGNYDSDSDPDNYIAVPCVWQNTTKTDLEVPLGAEEGYAYAVDVDGSDVYAAGEVNWPQSSACYWLNGSCVELDDDGYVSIAISIAVY